MELTFYLKAEQSDSHGRLMIHGRICWQSQKVRFSTGEKVLPNHFKNERVKATLAHATHINQTLGTYRSELETFFYRHQNDPTQTELTTQAVQAEINRIRVELLQKKSKPALLPPVRIEPITPSLQEFAPQYIAEMKADRSSSWGNTLNTIMRQLAVFRPGLEWSTLTINTLNQFKVYLQEEKELSDNTIHTYISLFRGMCEYAERSGIVVPRDIFWVETRMGEVIRPSLEAGDEQKILDATLHQNQKVKQVHANLLEMVRWYFILSCHTGLRRSDQWQYLNPRIERIENTPCLMALQQKTGNRVAIPLSETAYYLLRNPITDRKPPLCEPYNQSLRLIGRQAKLNQLVTVGSFYKGKLLADAIPLYDAMSSHMARHTFATRMTAGGINTFTLKELMGHKSLNSTQRYQTVSNPDIVKHTLEAWAKGKR
jgi:site-specific recombinase XerD